MDEQRQERREEEDRLDELEGRGEKERTLKTPSRRRGEEEEELEMMKAGAKDVARRKLIAGHTPISSSSFTFSPFLSSSLCGGRGEGEEDEVRVTIVTIEDESCPSEPFGTVPLETANRITRTEDGGDEQEDEAAVEEEDEEDATSDEREEEVTSPLLHLQSLVGPRISSCVD